MPLGLSLKTLQEVCIAKQAQSRWGGGGTGHHHCLSSALSCRAIWQAIRSVWHLVPGISYFMGTKPSGFLPTAKTTEEIPLSWGTGFWSSDSQREGHRYVFTAISPTGDRSIVLAGRRTSITEVSKVFSNYKNTSFIVEIPTWDLLLMGSPYVL